MKTNETKTTTARKLSLDEIRNLPFASVIWASSDDVDYGVVWHWKMPVVIGVPGEYGYIIGGDKDSIFIREINNVLMDDPSITYWSQEPDDLQLPGITEAEFNASPCEESIVCPQLAKAITGRKITFSRFCDQLGIDFGSFWDAMTGKRYFKTSELLAIAQQLNTSVDEFCSPEAAVQI